MLTLLLLSSLDFLLFFFLFFFDFIFCLKLEGGSEIDRLHPKQAEESHDEEELLEEDIDESVSSCSLSLPVLVPEERGSSAGGCSGLADLVTDTDSCGGVDSTGIVSDFCDGADITGVGSLTPRLRDGGALIGVN